LPTSNESAARPPEQDWRQNFHAVWPALFATSMGLMAVLPMLPLYIEERFGITDPEELTFWAGAIYGVAPLTAAILGPLWGALGDRVGKKPMAIRANLAIAATTALMPLAETPIWLLLARVLQGAFAGYVAPSMALVSQRAPRHLHGTVIARLQVAMAAGTFLGPFLGAELAFYFGRASIFWMTSLFTAIAGVQLWLRAHDSGPSRPPEDSFVRGLTTSVGALLRNKVFTYLLLLVLLLRLGQNMLEPYVSLLIRKLGAPDWILPLSETPAHAVDRTIGVAFGLLAVSQLLFTPLWGRGADRYGPLRCLYFLALFLGSVLLATAFVSTTNEFLLLRFGAAATMAGSMTLAYAAVSKRVLEKRRALAFSLVQSCMQLGFALGPQLGGMVAIAGAGTEPNYRRAFLVAAGLCFVAAVGMFFLRRLPPTPVDDDVDAD